jgi:nicotinate-nucleotide adenylyltransferase
LSADQERVGVAVFGGTFDPVHFGHLRSALELLEALSLAQLRFMPAREPPHRGTPAVSAEDRARMVELAIAGEARFACDRRELHRSGPSYSYDSLSELREELGASTPLCLVMGCDALLGLPGWYRWRELSELAHLLVIARPGWTMPDTGELAEFVRERAAKPEALKAEPAGRIISQTLRPQDISATAIRALLQSGQSARYLLPDSVLAYITERRLYTGALVTDGSAKSHAAKQE